jgi:amino acid adenylation domain-containing protein
MSTVTERLDGLSPEQRRDILAQMLRDKTKKPKTAPLSFAQERMWFLNQVLPANPAFNMFNAIRLSGQLDVVALKWSLDEIGRRHETLRTTFAAPNGRPVQVIAPALTMTLPVVDLEEIPEAERDAQARCLIAEEARRPLDVNQSRLFRVRLLRLCPQEHVLLLNLHHIISDGWSQVVLLRELTSLYTAFTNTQYPSLPEPPIQYAEFVHWQRQTLTANVLDEELAYWKQQLAGPLPVLELVTDRSTAAGGDSATATKKHTFSRSLTDALKALSRQEGVTLFVTLLAAYKTLLYRYTGQTDVVVGSPIANRDRAELEAMIGLFLNTLVLRTDLSGDPTFLELLGRVRRVVLEAFAHKDLPFGHLVGALQPQRDLNRNPLFQVVFILQDTPALTLELPNLRLSPLSTEAGIEAEIPTLIGVSIQETGGELVASLDYRTDILSQKVLEHLQVLLEGVVADPRQRLSTLPLLTEAERRRILVSWNHTQADYPTGRCIHQLFEQQVKDAPDAVALVFMDQHLTYCELNRRANQLAHHLQALGVGPKVLVGVCAERSPELVVALYAILKAGGAYVPLDPSYPQERLAYMLADAQPPVLLTQQHLLDHLPNSLLHTPYSILLLDTDWQTIAQQQAHDAASEVGDDNLAYVIYTSGSTGRPKGAMNTHAGIRNRLLWMQEAYQLTGTDRVLQKTPFSFDVSVWEFFWPLLNGACLVVARPEGHKDSAYLVDTIVAQHVTTIHFVPSMLQVFLGHPQVQNCRSLRRVFCSGEALPFDLQARFFARLGVELHNLYGPTEAAVDVTYWPCERQSNQSLVPIGRPIANIHVYLLDAQLQPVPVGVPGELHLGGVGLARGYLRRPELSAERFIPNPCGGEPGARLYKTGDLAYYLSGGDIVFVGRIDHQVKVRGFRIELGEIEATLAQHPVIREAVVVARDAERESMDKQLVGYVVPGDGQAPAAGEMRRFLQQKLPEYMLPAHFVALEALPLTPNGKVDRKALPAPDGAADESRAEFVAPETILEERLAEIWSVALGVAQIGIYDNFFDLGGTSLLGTEVIYQINDVFEMNLSARHLFQAPTVASLAVLIEKILIAELEEETEEL